MEPGDLDVVGTALHRYMLRQGMPPSGETDTEEGSVPRYSDEDAKPKRPPPIEPLDNGFTC